MIPINRFKNNSLFNVFRNILIPVIIWLILVVTVPAYELTERILFFVIFFMPMTIIFNIEFEEKMSLWKNLLFLTVIICVDYFYPGKWTSIALPVFIVLFEKKQMFIKLIASYLLVVILESMGNYIFNNPTIYFKSDNIRDYHYGNLYIAYFYLFLNVNILLLTVNIFNFNLKKAKKIEKWRKNIIITNGVFFIILLLFVVFYLIHPLRYHPLLTRFLFYNSDKILNVFQIFAILLIQGIVVNGITYLLRKRIYPSTIFYFYLVIYCYLSIVKYVRIN